MALMYYAKVNINSHILDCEPYNGKLKIDDILNQLVLNLNDKTEYDLIMTYKFNGEIKEKRETYNFIDLKKVKDDDSYYVTGKIVRRYPYFTEIFDEVARKVDKEVISHNSSSIFFYFDVKREVVTFCNRQKFKHVQFVNAFENLINLCCKDIGFKVCLISDPKSIKEKLESAHKITRIESTIIVPNINEEAMDDIFDVKVKKLKSSNISKKIDIVEQDSKNKSGIIRESKYVSKIINENQAFLLHESGYGKLSVEGEYSDGTKYKFNSDEDSPYVTVISDELKDVVSEIIRVSKIGIEQYIVNLMKKRIELKSKKGNIKNNEH